VICLHEGVVAFEGSVKTLYDNPPSARIGAFLGPLNWLSADEAKVFFSNLLINASEVGIRPERLQIHIDDTSEIELVSTPFLGAYGESVVRHVASGRTTSLLHQMPGVTMSIGQRVTFRILPQSGAAQ
ncbi:MAG: hypothetical protein O2856_20540, partial [Planctomycetota bacterium]|nr:hypothetical protein [Planctomycetota bacterium]